MIMPAQPFPSSPSVPAAQPLWLTAFTALIVLMPLPFGANRQWASDLFGVSSALILMGMAFDVYRWPALWPAGGPSRWIGWSLGLMACVFVWAFLQTQSWMPQAWHHPLWKEAQNLPHTLSGSISIDPDQFPESIIRILGYTVFFLLAFVAGRNSTHAKFLLKALGIAAVAYAFYGLLMQSTGLRLVLWYNKWAYQEFVTSTFINKNSYATYAGLGLQVCLAMFWQHLKRRPKAGPDVRSLKAAWLEKFLRQDIPYLIMGLLVLGALLLTGSRAGIASGLAGSGVFFIALAINRRWSWKRWLTVGACCLAVLLSYTILSGNLLLDRLDQSQMQYDAPLRLEAYAISLRAIAANPWLGFGLGSFESAFRLYRDPEFSMWFQHAHNDYLELALELGLPAAFMYLTAIFLMVICCVQGVWRRHRQEIFPALGLSTSVTVGLHALADFSMQMPAVAATYAVLLGLGVAQSWSSQKNRDKLSSLDSFWT
jgi:O-antigen ligase